MNRSSQSGPRSAASPSLQSLRASRGTPPPPLRRFRGWIIAAGVVVLLILFGFLGLPPIVKAQAVKQLSARLGREVTIGKVRVNPLVLSATVEDFAIAEAAPAAGEFAGWRRFHANLDSWPLIVGRIRFQAIELDGFRARVAKGKDGGLNFDDIVARLGAVDPAAPSAAERRADEKPVSLAIARLSVADARVSFDDASRTRAFAAEVGPLTFTLENFKTVGDPDSPYQFEAVTAAGERVAWKGTVSADPVKSRGELVLANIDLAKLSPYYHQLVKGELRSAFADVSGRYTFDLRDGVPVVTLADGAFTLRDVRFGAPGVEADAFALKRLAVTGVSADSATLRGSVAKVAVDGVRLKATRDAQGIDLLRLVEPVREASGAPAAAAPASPASASASTAAPIPHVTLGEFSLADVQVEVVDLTTPRRAEHRIDDVRLALRDLDSADLAKSIPLSLQVKLPKEGGVSVGGTVAARPLAADLQVALENISFANASPYVEPFLNIRVAGGALRAAGKVTLRDGAAGFAGDVGVSGFSTVDGKQAAEFVKWSDFTIAGILFGSEPATLHADLIRIVDPSATFRIESDGTLNIARAGARTGAAKSPAPEAGASARMQEDLPATKPTSGPLTGPVRTRNPLPLAVTVDRFEIVEGAFRYEDRSIQPTARAALTGFTGSVSGLSSEALGRADVDLRGRVDGVAPVSITGKLNPLGVPAFVDVKLDFKNIDLQPGAGPYVGKSAGQKLSRGNLSVAVKASLDERKVNMSNLVTLDQFYLGTKTNSPDATKLPVGLALALLRDTQGRIVLDVPVQGSLDDPEFRVGRVIVRVLGNILVKAATSPFSLLGAAFGGGGDELGWQDFAAGSAAPDEAGIKKLETVAKALNGRPALMLDIVGAYDPVADLAALRRAALDREVRAEAWDVRRQVDPNTPPPDQMEITPDLRAGMVARLHAAAFPPGDGTAEGPPKATNPDAAPRTPFSPSAPVSTQEDFRRVGRLPKYSAPAPRPPGSPANPPSAGASVAGGEGAVATDAPGITPAEMEMRLAERIEIPAAELHALAEARAQAVRAWLLGAGKVSPERVFLAPIIPGGARVNLDLK